MARIDELLSYLMHNKGSDLHMAAGLEPRVRIGGSIEAVNGWPPVSDADMRAMMREICDDRHWDEFERTHDTDFAYGIEGLARFRANFFVQERGAGCVFRIIPEEIVSLETLALPDVIGRFADLAKGLVLVTGPTGSGKSTTLAAIIDRINTRYQKHIVTIEDPIEFVHQNKRSVLSQREVGQHTDSFAGALRAAIRQNPDVVLVGEMRDLETISLAITAAEMGVLVFGTLHTNSAPKTVDRLIDVFPADQQEQARLSLAESLAGIVSQLLLRTADGKGRCAAVEVLVKTSALPNMIREGNTPMLVNLIQNGKAQGMRTMDDSLMELVKAGRILPLDAYRKAADKAKFEALLPPDDAHP